MGDNTYTTAEEAQKEMTQSVDNNNNKSFHIYLKNANVLIVHFVGVSMQLCTFNCIVELLVQ